MNTEHPTSANRTSVSPSARAQASASKTSHPKTAQSITIGLPRAEVFAFWRDFENLPRFMKDLDSIESVSPKRSRWHVTLKSGKKVNWEAEITREIPGELIEWRSKEESDVQTAGRVAFSDAPMDLGTVIELQMDYSIPGGKLTEFLAQFTGESPRLLVATNLKRLKAWLETGEIPTTEGQPSGREELGEKSRLH